MVLGNIKLREREQTPGEEIANSVSHAVGGAVAVVAALFLITAAVQRGSVGGIVGASVFATTMVFVYLTSCLYTPFTLGACSGWRRAGSPTRAASCSSPPTECASATWCGTSA